MLNKIQNFFLELQQGDEETKKRWLVILTSSAMLAVILLWAIYLNFTVKNLGQKEEDSSQFLKTMETGFNIISQKTASELSQRMGGFFDIFAKTNSVTIKSEEFKAVMPNLEEINPKKLP